MERPLAVTRYVGVELEVSETRFNRDFLPRKTSIWHKKRDGSVEGVGTEYVFLKKETGKTVIDGVNYLCDMFERHEHRYCDKRIVTENVNNGFHLHLDYSHKTPEDAIRLCDVAHSITNWMFASVDECRRENEFCTTHPSIPSSLINEIIRNYGYTTIQSACSAMSRYSWIHAVQMGIHGYKTVEVRLHHGTGNRDEILTWIEWWTSLANKVDKGKVSPCNNLSDCKKLLDSLRLSEKTHNRFAKSLALLS